MGDYWTVRQGRRWTRRRFLQSSVGAAAAAGAATMLACGDDDDEPSEAAPTERAGAQPKRGGVYRTSATGSPPQLDTYKTTSFLTAALAGGVYSRLFVNKGIDLKSYPSFEVEPDAAASFEIPDPTTYTIKLRNNVKFHPPVSRLMTSEDVVFSWNRFSGKLPGGSPAAYLPELNMVDSITAVDPLTVQLKLKRPFAPLLNKLADDYFLLLFPKETGQAFDPSQKMVGSGPWVMAEHTNAVGTKLRRHSEWHLGPTIPYMDGIDVAVLPEYATGFTQFLAGNLDNYGNLTPDDVIRARDQIKGANINNQTDPYMGALSFSNEENVPWRDPRVRQAVSMALDRDAIFDLLYSGKKLTAAGLKVDVRHHNLFPVGAGKAWLDPTSDKVDPKVRPFFKFDVEGAKKLLAEAGHPNGFSAPYHYSEIYGANWKQNAEIIPQMLSRAGIRLTSVVEDVGRFTSRTNVGQFDGLALVYWGFAYPEHVLEFQYIPGATRNTSKVDDPAINQRVNAILGELNTDRRTQMMLDIQNLLAEKMYYVPAVYDSGPRWNAYQPHVKDSDRFRTVRSGGYAVGNSHLWLDK